MASSETCIPWPWYRWMGPLILCRLCVNLKEYVQNAYQHTINYWQRWIAQSNYSGRWQEIVNRSALTLKLLISGRYGSMVAAPTFSLPESIGNGRNWDYRSWETFRRRLPTLV